MRHFSNDAKGSYGHSLRLGEKYQLAGIIADSRDVFIHVPPPIKGADKGKAPKIVIVAFDAGNENKVTKVVLDKSDKGAYIVTTGKVDAKAFENESYKKAQAGNSPTTPSPANPPAKTITLITMSGPREY